jgi:TM2 domain-containing membrane protein YozV
MKQKKTKAIGYLLAFFLGGLGAHLFYFGKYVRGTLYLLFSWTYIPIFLAWFDMLFIHKWVRESIGEKRGEIYPEYKELLSRSRQKPSMPILPINTEGTFYKEENIILPKYAHLTTPKHILDEIHQIKNPKKDSIDTKYGISIEFSLSTSNTDFIKESLGYAYKRENPCQHQPLKAYYTTYRDLNSKQKKWFFYWREQVLNGNYLDTDLSYIFLFVYELLNYTFNKKASFNISMLERLYTHYLDTHPNLEHYLSRWMSDFLVELKEEELANEWYKENSYENKLYTTLVTQKEKLEKISITVWKPYIINYRETAFFRPNKNKIYKTFKESVPLLERAYEEQGKDILKEWFRRHEDKRSRQLFPGAVISRKTEEYVDISYSYKSTEEMYDQITALFRLSENVVRKLVGENREIKVNDEVLPQGIKERMLGKCSQTKNTDESGKNRFKKVQDKTIDMQGSKIPKREEAKGKQEDEENEKLPFSLDFDRINLLRRESDSLQAVFTERAAEEEQETEVNYEANNNGKNAMIEEVDIFSPTDHEEDVEGFIQSLEKLEIDFLIGFKDGLRQISEAHQFIKSQGVLPGVFINSLNEKSMEYLGDNIIEPNDENYEVYEEFVYVVNKM